MKKLREWFQNTFLFLRGRYWFNRCHDMAVEIARMKVAFQEELASNQVQADAFQQALTNVFDNKSVQLFFDEVAKLEKEHDDGVQKSSEASD